MNGNTVTYAHHDLQEVSRIHCSTVDPFESGYHSVPWQDSERRLEMMSALWHSRMKIN